MSSLHRHGRACELLRLERVDFGDRTRLRRIAADIEDRWIGDRGLRVDRSCELARILLHRADELRRPGRAEEMRHVEVLLARLDPRALERVRVLLGEDADRLLFLREIAAAVEPQPGLLAIR